MTLHPDLLRALDPLRDAPEVSAVLCDVDGTLAPIVARPEDADLAPGAREALTALRGRMRLVGFVSGRAVGDAMDLVGLPGYAYAGNHGMETCHPGGSPALASGVVRHLPAIRDFARRWPAERVGDVGVRLEEKGATLSYHARGAADPGAAAALLAGLADDARAAGLTPRPGREVMEVRPGVRIDKGTAVRALLARSGARRAVYFGDDWTDVDGWRALGELRAEGVLEVAVAVAVESAEVPGEVSEQADHRVRGPEEVVLALRHLAAMPDAGQWA
ncbi:MAG: trehalose-phosphatase [Miltoncostaeaceae bacterium]